jgi:hypothetical protein
MTVFELYFLTFSQYMYYFCTYLLIGRNKHSPIPEKKSNHAIELINIQQYQNSRTLHELLFPSQMGGG